MYILLCILVYFLKILLIKAHADYRDSNLRFMWCLLLRVEVRSLDSSHFSVYLPILREKWESHYVGPLFFLEWRVEFSLPWGEVGMRIHFPYSFFTLTFNKIK